MAGPDDGTEAKKHFLDARDAEVVHGPDVVADEVSAALKDADRFGLPQVKPPLAQALSEARRADAPAGPAEPGAQDALSGEAAAVDERAGSPEVLKPAGEDPA